MTRVLLGHSYFLKFDSKLWRAMQPYPPLGTLYAASVVRERGHEVSLFDAMLAPSTQGWRAAIERDQPAVAVLFEDNFNYLSKMCLLNMREAAFEMIGMAKAAGTTVIVAGADVTDHAADYLARGADYAIVGEGEETLVALLEALSNGADPATVEGIAFATDAGIVTTSARPNLRDLDALPPPAYDLVDLDAYRAAWQAHGHYSANLVAGRGCPFHCNWCAKPIWGQRYAVRSPAGVIDEVRRLRALGADHLWFMDDILGIKPGWLAELADGLEREGLVTPFRCLSRADLLLRAGEIDALRRAGCTMVWIGAESGAQSVLDAMEKGTTVEQIREAARRLREAGIGVAFFLQFGYPGETWSDIQQTLQLMRDCRPDDIGVSVSYPLPGTPFFARVRDLMRGRQNWRDSSDLAMLFEGPYSTAFYRILHARLHAEFRLQKALGDEGALRGVSRIFLTLRPKPLLAVARDAVLLRLLEARLELVRRLGRHDDSVLPAPLARHEAATPSAQDDAVATTISRT